MSIDDTDECRGVISGKIGRLARIKRRSNGYIEYNHGGSFGIILRAKDLFSLGITMVHVLVGTGDIVQLYLEDIEIIN
jgi:hypothetical protein